MKSKKAVSTKNASSSISLPLSSSKFVNLEEINSLYSKMSSRYHGKKEDYFALVYISKRFNISIEQASSFVNFEGDDYCTNAFYYSEVNKSLFLFVFKWSTDHMAFKDALNRLGTEGMNKIFSDTSARLTEDNQLVALLKTCLANNWNTIQRIHINFVFNGDPLDAEQSKVLSFLREGIEEKKYLIDNYFNERITHYNTDTLQNNGPQSNIAIPQCELVFQFVSNERNFGNTTSSRPIAEYNLGFAESLKISGRENELTMLFIPLWTLYQMYTEMGEKFFEKNIRSGLDDGNMTNYQIKKSLQKIVDGEEEPENFTLYHNGIAMTAQMLKISTDGHHSNTIKMVEPRVLNGVQTIKILKQFVEGNITKEPGVGTVRENNSSNNHYNGDDTATVATKDDEISNNDHARLLLKQKLSDIKIATRIIKSPNEDFLKRVTINNNRQNPIMPWNLRANDLIQIQFEESFGKMGIYYERRENAYKNLTDGDLDAIGTENGMIEIRKFAQTLLAMQGQIDRISEIKEVFENEAWYNDTFKGRYLDVDPRKFVLLYKVQYRLQSVIREIRSIGTAKYSYASKAKNLLWCLSIQGILNDNNFYRNYFEKYGNSVAIEAGITEILKRLASTKLRLILSDTLGSKKYREYVDTGQFSFLKTKTVFNDCMKTAAKLFEWDIMYL